MFLRNLATKMHETAVAKGFWSPPEMMDKYQAKLMLICTEVAEISEALRKNKGPHMVTEEHADVIIRTLDLHYKLVEDGLASYDLQDVIKTKMEKNNKRPALHGNLWG
jgi:NTP pyrophosphatase (non-canonical NTP hydrolase)